MSQSIRFRTWLRANTHFKNTHEFFVALLFECDAPPHPITELYISSIGTLGMHDYPSMNRWRDKIATAVSVRVHHSFDPTHIVQEYMKWLLRQQESNRLSVH